MRKAAFAAPLLAILLLGTACSQQKLSEAERRRQQEVLNADNIRGDMERVAGVYEGTLQTSAGFNQRIRLSLSVQDVPVDVDGEAHPVLTPKLVGTLRFVYNEAANEYIDAPIKTSEFFPSRSALNIVVNHNQFGDLTINYIVQGSDLSGNWTAPTMGANGVSTLRRN